MTCDRQTIVQTFAPTAATFLPPAMVDEAGWDILLALYADPHCQVTMRKLGGLVSVPQTVLLDWLADLEGRKLVSGANDVVTSEVWVVLTRGGRDLLDQYFSATSDLQLGAHH